MLRPENRTVLARSLAGTAARLLHRGRLREAMALRPARPGAVAARLLTRLVLTPSARATLRRLLGLPGGDVPVK